MKNRVQLSTFSLYNLIPQVFHNNHLIVSLYENTFSGFGKLQKASVSKWHFQENPRDGVREESGEQKVHIMLCMGRGTGRLLSLLAKEKSTFFPPVMLSVEIKATA
jgi:hypothetical protein